MAVFLTVLKVLGIVLLILAGLLLIIMLLVLFVPIRYSFSGSIDDPEGSSEVLHLDLKKDVAFEGSVRWLLGVFYGGLSAGGKDGDDEFIRVEVRILGKKVPLDRFLRKKEPEEEKKEEKPGEPEKKKTLDQKLEEFLNRIEKLYNRLQDVFHVLQSECGTRARAVLFFRLRQIVRNVMPREYGLTGVLGLGDPARSAQVFAVQGYLYPITAGHVAVGTDFELYRYDLHGAAQGRICLFSLAYDGIRILLNRDVRRLITRLRRGPGHRSGKSQKTQEQGKTSSAAA